MGRLGKQGTDTLPPRLYKHRRWTDDYGKVVQHSRVMLSHNAIYFSSARKFNDPFDCRIRIEFEEVSDTYIRERMIHLLKKRTPNISDADLQATVDFEMSQRTWENLDALQKWQEKNQERMFNQGIFGLSEPKDNLLMWSHYADKHGGFCVGFDSQRLEDFFDRLFVNDGTIIDSRIVQYVPDYPVFYFHGMDEEEFYVQPLITKSAVWEYEEEYRFILMDKANVQYSLDNGIIVEVIFGCEMPDEHKNEIKDVLREKGSKVQLFEARKKDKSFGLDFIPIDY